MTNSASMKVVLLPLLCLDAPARQIPQPAILNVSHEVLPDRDTTRMVGAIREGCTSADDNFCTAADGLIHSELRIHFAVLRHGRPLNHRIRAFCVVYGSTRKTNTDKNAFSMASRRNRITTQAQNGYFTRPKNVRLGA